MIDKKLIIHDISTRQTAQALHIEQDATIFFYGSQAQTDITIDVSGEVSADIVCIIYGNNTNTHCTLTIRLCEDKATAKVYILTLAWDHSHNNVEWTIYIAPNTKWCSGHLLQENLLLGKQLTLKSKPQLDVHSHDVSASHGARFESFDANKIFYMTAKWLAPKDAKQLLVEWYVTAALDTIPLSNEQRLEIKDTILGTALAI